MGEFHGITIQIKNPLAGYFLEGPISRKESEGTVGNGNDDGEHAREDVLNLR